MFANNEDLPNCALLAIGVNPATSNENDWRRAAAWLDKMKPLVRQFYSQNYIQALATGDVWITMAWSGDIFQQNLSGKAVGQELKFVIPKEGGLVWTDNFVILKEAKNPLDAMMLMDFYYQPKVAAMVTEWVNYVSPVPAAAKVVEADARRASGSRPSLSAAGGHQLRDLPDEADLRQDELRVHAESRLRARHLEQHLRARLPVLAESRSYEEEARAVLADPARWAVARGVLRRTDGRDGLRVLADR